MHKNNFITITFSIYNYIFKDNCIIDTDEIVH